MRRTKFSKVAVALLLWLMAYLYWWCCTPNESAESVGLEDRDGPRRTAGWAERARRRAAALLPPRAGPRCDSSGTHDLPVYGRGCYLREKLACPGLPTVHSAFAEAARLEVVFVGVRRRGEAWAAGAFVCEFPDGRLSLSDPVVRDQRSVGNGYPQYLAVITCPIPPNSTAAAAVAAGESRRRFTVNLRLASRPDLAYLRVPVCPTESRPRELRRQLSLCTMVKGMGEYLPDWLFYHRQLGVEHVYLYDNDPHTTFPADLAGYVRTGFLTIIPWAHTPSPNKTYLEVQIAHENDCLWRHRYDTHWMLKVDVDEFVQPMDPNRTRLPDYLSLGPRLESLAALRLRNWFFGRPLNAKRKVVTAPTVFERNTWRVPRATPVNRGRDKCLVRPLNVHYFKIHGVKVGGDTLTLDPEWDLRLVHYRKDNPRHRGFKMNQLLKDTSMFDLFTRMTGGKPVSPEMFASSDLSSGHT